MTQPRERSGLLSVPLREEFVALAIPEKSKTSKIGKLPFALRSEQRPTL
jgi:hypothetical protein